MPSNLESYKEAIFKKLRKVGTRGLSKTGLKIGKSRPKSRAIKELEQSQKIVNLGSKTRTRYVLPEFNKPLEIACERIERSAMSGKKGLFSRTKLRELSRKGCPSKIAKRLDDAIDWLIKEGKLLNLTYGKSILYLHISALQSFQPPAKKRTSAEAKAEKSSGKAKTAKVKTAKAKTAKAKTAKAKTAKAKTKAKTSAASELDRDMVLEAYQEVKQHTGFSNVEIYKLQQELDVPMDTLKEFLFQESRRGMAVLVKGDWSLSSEETRSGAIKLEGKRYLMVRF